MRRILSGRAVDRALIAAGVVSTECARATLEMRPDSAVTLTVEYHVTAEMLGKLAMAFAAAAAETEADRLLKQSPTP
jgi:hypothetical protein